jgi:hypothetical protein
MEEIPKSLIQLCETHQDGTFYVGRKKMNATGTTDVQDQVPRWNFTTHSISPKHPLTAWLWLKEPLFRVSPEPLRQRLMLDAITEWQERCAKLDFPRVLSKKKALEGFGSLKPELQQAKGAMIAMERFSDDPLLWILFNEQEKKISFLDDKAFPREGGYKQIWIIREPFWDRLWDASEWSSSDLVKWIEQHEDQKFKVEWPMEPSTSTMKAMTAEYEGLQLSAKGLTKDELRQKLGRAKAIGKFMN